MVKKLTFLEIKDNLAIIYMNNPPNNLINNQFLDSLQKTIYEAEKNNARAILITSKIKHFCAGADPDFFLKNSSKKKYDTMRLIRIVDNIKIPSVAAIKGAALGGGFELALGCDFIIAADTSRIGLVETSVGLIPLSGGVQRLINRVGSARTKEIAMFGRRYDAKTLENWGAINMVVPELNLLTASKAFSKQLSNGPTKALKEIKKIANNTAMYGIKKADTKMQESIETVLRSSDAKKGINFLAGKEKKINFKG